jgi:uncharacterized protein HemX
LSPADENAQAAPESAIKMTDLMVFSPEASSPRVRFHFKTRHKRTVLPAAAVAIAAALGVVIGIMAANQYVAPGRQQAANLSGRTAIQRSIGRLRKEIATLKESIAAADSAARSTTPKTTESLPRVPEITGSIPLPLTAAAVSTPKPRPEIAGSVRSALVHDRSIS